MIKYKFNWHKPEAKGLIEVNPKWTSKTCHKCGSIKADLTLKDRVYICDECGLECDRDYNASINLYALISKNIGQVLPEFTPADLTALQDDLAINSLVTSKVETGIQL